MTLLITVFAAVIATLCWYSRKDDTLHLGVLCAMFWGASLMWLADAIFAYAEEGADYFTPGGEDMLNDSFLGLSVIALALVVWIAVVLFRDSRGVVRAALRRK